MRRKNPTGALVLGGAHGSLAVARSLGQRGIPVWFLTHDHSIASYSRFVRQSWRWTGPNRQDAVPSLLELARRYDLEGCVLFACGDEEVQLVSKHHETLSDVFRLVTPPWSITKWTLDKRLTYERAAALGVDHPSSYNSPDPGAAQYRFPVILKPAIRENWNAFTSSKAWRADTQPDLARKLRKAAAMVGKDCVIIQELVPGNGLSQFSYAALWNCGKPVVSLVARRTRQFPVEFGFTSTFVETVQNAEVECAANRFLASIDYTGLVEVEFKYDARDSRYKLLDVNARPWTWIALGAKAGVDFPHAAWQMAKGEPVPSQRALNGVGWIHAWRDVMAASQEMYRRRAAIGYARSLAGRPLTHAAFKFDDPLPGLADLPLSLGRYLMRRLPLTFVRRSSSPASLSPEVPDVRQATGL